MIATIVVVANNNRIDNTDIDAPRGGLPSDDVVDLQTAAERLGVHYQTAHKWVRSGQLRGVLIRGRYVIATADLDAFSAQRDRPRSPAARRPRSGLAPLADQMFQHLIMGNEGPARELVDGLIVDGVPLTTVMQEVLVPPLVRIGNEWHAGRLSIWVEHQATAIVERILGAHHPTPRGRRRGTAVVAALAGDVHDLPTSMAAAALRDDNWNVHHLGADMPGDQIVEFCAQTTIDLAVLTVTNPAVLPLAEQTAALLESHGIRTIIGVPGRTLDELLSLARSH